MKLSIAKKEGSEVEFSGEISFSELEKHRALAVSKLSADLSIPGFRKGHVPERILAERIGEMRILEAMAERALAEHYEAIIIESGVIPIAHPRVTITKLAEGNPLGFILRTAVYPEVRLPDYLGIARHTVPATSPAVEVEAREVQEAIQSFREHASRAAEGSDSVSGALPVFDDAFVRSLGTFENVDDFTAKLHEQIGANKRQRERDKIRAMLVDALIADTTVDVPNVLVDGELKKMLSEFRGSAERLGVAVDDYLRGAKKTEEELLTEWRPDALKRSKTQLILNAIAKKETIAPDADAVSKEVDHILAHRKNVKPEHARMYIGTVLTNEKVFQFLESVHARTE